MSVALVALAACRPAAQAPAVVSAGQPVAAAAGEGGEDMDEIFLEDDCLRVLAPEHAPAPDDGGAGVDGAGVDDDGMDGADVDGADVDGADVDGADVDDDGVDDDGVDDGYDVDFGVGEARAADKPPAGARGVTVLQPDEDKLLFVCLVDIFSAADDGGVYTLGLIARRPRWTAIQTFTYSYSEYDTTEDDKRNEGGYRDWREESSADLALVAISPEEDAVVLTLSSSKRGIEETASTKDETLYRVTDSGLVVLLSVGSREAGNEVGSAEEIQSFEITDSLTLGYYDIRVASDSERVIYGDDDDRSTESGESWYRWNGTDYVIAQP